MNRFFRNYNAFSNRFPIITQAFQTGALMGAGDIIAQTVVEKKSISNIHWRRTFNFSLIGLIIVGPSLRVWYGYLDRVIPKTSNLAAVKKMAMDQFLFAPIFIIIILSSIGVTKGQSPREIHNRLKEDYKDVLVNNYKLWPAVQLCNFYIVPLHFQVPVVQCVAIFWNTYLSWKSNRDVDFE